MKFVLDAEQSGASSDLIVTTHNVQKVSFFILLLLRILVMIPKRIFENLVFVTKEYSNTKIPHSFEP